MVRPFRIHIENGWYHVFGRGIERRAIFSADRDREHFLELVAGLHERYRFVIHCYALMSNHYHCILQIPDANLSQGMQWFHGSYSAWYNAKHDRVGPLFQGRFRAIPIENSVWAYSLSQYVHLNALRIASLGLDKRGRVLEGKGFRIPSKEQVTERLRLLRKYRWSSYRGYAGYDRTPPDWLEMKELLRRAHRDVASRRKQYREDIRHHIAYGMEPTQAERLRDAVAIGSIKFARKMREIPEKVSLRGVAGKCAMRQRFCVEEVKAAVEQLKGEPWDTFITKRGDWGRPLFLWGARRLCGLTLRELGRAAGGMEFAAVSAALKRFERKAAEDESLVELQRQLKTILNAEL